MINEYLPGFGVPGFAVVTFPDVNNVIGSGVPGSTRIGPPLVEPAVDELDDDEPVVGGLLVLVPGLLVEPWELDEPVWAAIVCTKSKQTNNTLKKLNCFFIS